MTYVQSKLGTGVREQRILPLSEVVTGPGESARLEARPQVLFEIHELHLLTSSKLRGLLDLVVDDIQIGTNSQFVSGPGGFGQCTCPALHIVGRRLDYDIVQVNSVVIVRVRNVGKKPIAVRGSLLGEMRL